MKTALSTVRNGEDARSLSYRSRPPTPGGPDDTETGIPWRADHLYLTQSMR